MIISISQYIGQSYIVIGIIDLSQYQCRYPSLIPILYYLSIRSITVDDSLNQHEKCMFFFVCLLTTFWGKLVDFQFKLVKIKFDTPSLGNIS